MGNSVRPPPAVSPFGLYLRERRTSAGKSLRAVAKALGITHVYLGEVERGRRRLLPQKYWKPLTKAVPGITLANLHSKAAESEPIDPSMFEGPGREVVHALARKLENEGLSDDDAEKLLSILRGVGGRTDD